MTEKNWKNWITLKSVEKELFKHLHTLRHLEESVDTSIIHHEEHFDSFDDVHALPCDCQLPDKDASMSRWVIGAKRGSASIIDGDTHDLLNPTTTKATASGSGLIMRSQKKKKKIKKNYITAPVRGCRVRESFSSKRAKNERRDFKIDIYVAQSPSAWTLFFSQLLSAMKFCIILNVNEASKVKSVLFLEI